MACLQLYRLAVSSVRGQGVFHHATYSARRGGHNAVARDHGRQGEAPGRNIVVEKRGRSRRGGRSILHVRVGGEGGADGIDVGGHVMEIGEGTLYLEGSVATKL